MKSKRLMTGWERGFNSLLFLFLIPLLSLSVLVPTGGRQPHDSVFLPVGPSVIPLLFFLASFLFVSILQHFSAGFSQMVTYRKRRVLLKMTLETDFYRNTLRFWPHKMIHLMATNDFGQPRISLWAWPAISLVFITDTGHGLNIFSLSKFSHLLLLLPHHLSSYRQWFREQQCCTETSRHHSDTLREKDFYFLFIWFRL